MKAINLQEKTNAGKGSVEAFWYKNQSIGLERTLFHQMKIPLKSIESEADDTSQPIDTQIVLDWLNLNLRDPLELDRLVLKSTPEDDSEISIYIGGAHNPCDLKRMAINKIGNNLYEIDCVLRVDFEHEKVAANEIFKFKTQIELSTEIRKSR